MATQNIYDMADTWNSAGTTFTAIKMNVTDTASQSASLLIDLQVGGSSRFNVSKGGAGFFNSSVRGGSTSSEWGLNYYTQGLQMGSSGRVAIGSTAAGPDVGISRPAAGILRVDNGSTGGGALEMIEQTAPSAASANGVRLYAEDNGSGKTRLMALFASGAAQQVAIEP